jgi:hypothetical protein
MYIYRYTLFAYSISSTYVVHDIAQITEFAKGTANTTVYSTCVRVLGWNACQSTRGIFAQDAGWVLRPAIKALLDCVNKSVELFHFWTDVATLSSDLCRLRSASVGCRVHEQHGKARQEKRKCPWRPELTKMA